VKKAAAKSKKAPTKKKAGGHSRGRPRKNASAEEEEEEQGQPPLSPPLSLPGTPGVVASLTGAAAAAKSASIRREEGHLLRDRNEQLHLSKDLEKKAAEAEVAKAHRRNPAGGADSVVVTRPQRYRVPGRNPDGSLVVHKATQNWGDVGGSQLSIPVADPNA
jgi:hypothetical protein